MKSASLDLLVVAARGEQRRLVDEVREVGADHPGRRRRERAEIDVRRRAARRACAPRGSSRGRSGPAAARRRAGRTGPAAAAPGRARPAGWSPPITITPVDESKPSISVRIWFSVCSRSSLPPLKPATPDVRERPIASSSSMKMIAGAASFACVKRSRTREAPTPTIASTNSDADIEKNGTSASPATARASSVLPVPGGPLSSTPCGIRAAEPAVLVRVAQEVDDLGQLLLRLVDAGDVGEGDACRRSARSGARASGRTSRGRSACCPARRVAQTISADEQDRRAEADEQVLPPGRARCRAAAALTTTPLLCSSCESASVLANAGISVLKRVVGFDFAVALGPA